MKNKNKFIIFIISLIFILLMIIPLLKNNNIDISDFENKEIKTEILIENLDTPWALDFLPDGRIIFTERPGRVSIYDFDKKEKISIAKIPVTEISESGLAGIAVDPDFEENNFIYLYYTYKENNNVWNRVSRFIFDNNKLKDEKILLDKIPAAKFHDGGRIKFGPDEKLYITTGDARVPSTAQDINSIAGKILRMNKDGSAPKDNPFNNLAYSYGHRNSQGLAWNFEKNIMYETEHGPTRRDEVNIIEKSKNYGWPTTCDVPSAFEQPIRCYTEFTLAPGGIAFYKNNLYIAGLRGTQLRKITLAEDGKTVIKEEELFSGLGRIREVVEHNGYLYIATSNRDGRGFPRPGDDKILRMKLN